MASVFYISNQLYSVVIVPLYCSRTFATSTVLHSCSVSKGKLCKYQQKKFLFFICVYTQLSIKVNREILDARSLVRESLWIFNTCIKFRQSVFSCLKNMFLVLNFNFLELHVQLKFDPIQFNEMSYFFLSRSKKISSPFCELFDKKRDF